MPVEAASANTDPETEDTMKIKNKDKSKNRCNWQQQRNSKK